MPAQDQWKKRLKLLIVDPSENERMMMKTVFEHQHDIIVAENVEEGYDLAWLVRPDVVIADHSWNIDGMKLCTKLRKNLELSCIPFVLMSSFSKHVGEMRHFKAGCDQILYKPFKGMELLAAVMTAIRRNAGNRLIHVLYRTGEFDFVAPPVLDDLIANQQIVCFKRASGIVVINKDPLRSSRQGAYDGPERRQGAFG